MFEMIINSNWFESEKINVAPDAVENWLWSWNDIERGWNCSWKDCCPWQGGRGCAGLRRKVWTQMKILSPNLRYFVAIIRFVAIYAPFGGQEKGLFLGSNTVYICGKTWRSALSHDIYCMLYVNIFCDLYLLQGILTSLVWLDFQWMDEYLKV